VTQVTTPPTDPRHQAVTDALTAEWYRRVREQIAASPEEHCAAMATVVLTALDQQKGN
jgi:hypothetical protein